MSDVFEDMKRKDAKSQSKAKPEPREAKTPRVKPPEWPSATKPRLNFMPDRHRKVEYGRRAVRTGAMLVLATTLAVVGGSFWADTVKTSLQKDLQAVTSEITEADTYLQEKAPIREFYANYVDQREAVSLKFNDELSANRVFTELNNLAGSSVELKDINYDLSDKSCLGVDPFIEMERQGCISLTGTASSPSALAGFLEKVNSSSALFSQAQVSEAVLAEKRMEFTMRTGYSAEAESNRGQEFTPTDEELGKVVKSIPLRFSETQVENNG